MPSISAITTVYNESAHIAELLESYRTQSQLADELIIVDALSTDGTGEIISAFAKSHPKLHIKLIRQKCNRSEGRNLAVKVAKSEYLVFTDAGCRLDSRWLEELVREQARSRKQVVGGFFAGLAQSKLQEAIIPYFLQLNHLDETNFTPTTRSLLMEKQLLLDLGGFREELELSEDFELVRRIRARRIQMAFARKAVVYWYPPADFKSFLAKITSFAESDIEAGILRPKVVSIYLRYVVFVLFFAKASMTIGAMTLFVYLAWSIFKNYKHCTKSWCYLPLLQVSSDLAIMWTTLLALPKFSSRGL